MNAVAAAIDALFADPNIGVDAVYTADGGAPVLVRVVARRADAITDFGDARLWSETARIDLRVVEMPTLFIAAPPNGGSVWVRVVDEVSGGVFEQEITADLPANTQFLSPRLFMNNGATAAAVAYDCSGVYVEIDY